MAKIIKCKTLDDNYLYIDIETVNFIPIKQGKGIIYVGSLCYEIDPVTAHFIMALKLDETPVTNVIDTSEISYDRETNTFTIGAKATDENEDDDVPPDHMDGQMTFEEFYDIYSND